MKSILVICLIFLLKGLPVSGQEISNKLKFSQGQEIEVTMSVKTKVAQEAMGQAIDYSMDGLTTHLFTVTNTNDDNTTLHHSMKRISYTFEGMGQKRTFDSDIPRDMEGQSGKTIRDLLDKTYDMAIDPSGKVIMVMPEKIETADPDPRMMLIMGMLKDVVETIQPPKKNEASFFKIMPDSILHTGSSWTETTTREMQQSNSAYKITDINDSTIVIAFVASSMVVTKAEMMGMETTTTMNNNTSGNIILDRKTGIIRQKSSITDTNGSMEVMGSTVPVNSRITTVITAKSLQ